MYSVILIDDEPWSMVDIKRSIDFAAMDMEVVAEFQDSVSALIHVSKQAPDIIITDIRMPHVSGIELIRRLRENDLASEVIIISGFQDFGIAKQAMSYGVCGYCLKPIDPAELTELLAGAKLNIERREGAAREGEPTGQEMDAFDKLCQHMKLHYAEKLQLKPLCEQFFISTSHCSYLFAKRKNTTFSRYLQAIRLKAAKTLLTETSRPLAEVAAMAGYSDYFYFSRVFKQEEGLSPKDYRRQNRAEERGEA